MHADDAEIPDAWPEPDDHPPLGPGEQLEALGDHLLLEAFGGEEERTPTGLVLPQSALPPANGYRRFRVLAVGPLCSDDRTSEIPETTLGPGDIVVAPAAELGLYREAGLTYYIARYDEIAAVIRRAR